MKAADQEYLGIASQFTRVPYFAKDQVREMARILKRRCKSADVARRCADHFLGQETPEAPTDFQVKNWVYVNLETAEENDRLRMLRAGELCEHCENSGKRIVNMRRNNPITGQPTEYDAQDFCTCEIGQILRRLSN